MNPAGVFSKTAGVEEIFLAVQRKTAGFSLHEQPWGRDVVILVLTRWGQDEDRRRPRPQLVKPIEPAALEDSWFRCRLPADPPLCKGGALK